MAAPPRIAIGDPSQADGLGRNCWVPSATSVYCIGRRTTPSGTTPSRTRSFCNGDLAAVARIQAKTLLLTSQTDRTIPAYLSRELYAGIKNAQYIEVPTIRGHLGGAAPLKGSAEEAFITDRIRPFLDSL
jgi:homoserine acetyltransferase